MSKLNESCNTLQVGMTTFSGHLRPAINFRSRLGERYGSIVLVRAGYSGNWFGVCDVCQQEALYTKGEIRRASFRCKRCPR